MRQTILTVVAVAISLVLVEGKSSAQTQTDKQPTMEERATQEADRLATLLDLESWQIFYVDSTLQHDYVALEEEFKALTDAKVSNLDIYQITQDKWADQIDKTYQSIFNEEQWAKYLKSGAAKQQKAREKRKAKAEKNAEK